MKTPIQILEKRIIGLELYRANYIDRKEPRFIKLVKEIDQNIKEHEEAVEKLKSNNIENISDSDFQLKRLYDWMTTPKERREPAQTKFTSGWLRTVAKEIEFVRNPKP